MDGQSGRGRTSDVQIDKVRLMNQNWTVFEDYPSIFAVQDDRSFSLSQDRPGPFSLKMAFSSNTVLIRVLSHLHHDQSKFMSHLNDSQVSILFLTAF